MARANLMLDAALREAFLGKVPENARTMRLYVEWGA
jgi:hypothetical protein